MGKSPDTLFQKSGAVRIISVVFGVERRTLKWLVVGNEQVMQSASFFLICAGDLMGPYILPSINTQNRDQKLDPLAAKHTWNRVGSREIEITQC